MEKMLGHVKNKISNLVKWKEEQFKGIIKKSIISFLVETRILVRLT